MNIYSSNVALFDRIYSHLMDNKSSLKCHMPIFTVHAMLARYVLSLCICVCVFVSNWLNLGSCKQCHMIAQGFWCQRIRWCLKGSSQQGRKM